MNSAQLINQDSGDYEYYTDMKIVNAAREVMGRINLDPASSRKAQKKIKAEFYLSEHGLHARWSGNVWLNHPFSRENNPLWINKLISEHEKGHLYSACCITYAATSEQWFQPLLDFPQCYLSPRTNYYLPDGTLKKGVTKGSCVTYMGSNIDKFVDVFHNKLGKVKLCP